VCANVCRVRLTRARRSSCPHSRGRLQDDCFYINYGIEQDWSFDTNLSALGCTGLALDPTVTHPSELEPNVLFLKLAAPTVRGSAPRSWQVMSLPRLWKLQNKRPVFAVKYDCEGCEYALSQDGPAFAQQRAEMLEFFQHVRQLNIELHLVRNFLDTAEKLNNLASMLLMLADAGLQLVSVEQGGCGVQKLGERYCASEVYDAGIPCGLHTDCSSYLFARR